MMKQGLTDEAQAILKAAVASQDGTVRLVPGGPDTRAAIAVDVDDLIPDRATAREIANWLGGLDDLIQMGYMQTKPGKQMDVFIVTREGYNAWDELEKR